MKSKFTIGSVFLVLSCIGCAQDYVDNSRIYVEGKITSQNQSANQLPIKLENLYHTISKGTTGNDGTFRLGGPDVTSDIELIVGKKIISFSADQQGCTLSEDSLSIVIPEDKHHVKFSNITID